MLVLVVDVVGVALEMLNGPENDMSGLFSINRRSFVKLYAFKIVGTLMISSAPGHGLDSVRFVIYST